MKKIALLALLLIIMILSDYYEFILFNTRITDLILALVALYGVIGYRKEFRNTTDWIVHLLLISIGTLIIILSLINYIPEPVIIRILVGYLVSSIAVTLLTEGNIFKDYKKIIRMGFGYFLTMYFLGHLLLSIGFHGGLYPTVQDKVYEKCIEQICVDVHKTKWKLNFFTVYGYNKNYAWLKFPSKSPEVRWTPNRGGEINLEFGFSNKDGKYLLDYTDLDGKEKTIEVKYKRKIDK